MVPNFTQKSKHLQQYSHEVSNNNELSCSRPHLDDHVFSMCWGGGNMDLCFWDLGPEDCGYSRLTELASDHWFEHTCPRPGWQWDRMQVLCHPKTDYISETTHPSLDHWFAGTESPLLQDGTLKTLKLKNLTTGLMEDHKGHPPSLPYNCRHPKQAGTDNSHHITNQHPKRERACAYQPVENPPEISQFHFHLKFLCFDG